MNKKYPDLGHLRIDAIGSINQAIELSVKVYDLEKDLASAHQHATEVAARVVELEREKRELSCDLLTAHRETMEHAGRIIELERELKSKREALEKIASCSMSQFASIENLAWYCVEIAATEIESGAKP